MREYTHHGPKAPCHSRSFALLFLLLTGCTRFDILNAMVPSCGYTCSPSIAYGKLPRQTLDVYRAKSDKPAAGIVVFFYGGSWQTGKKADYRFVAEALTSQGYIAVLPDYRLYPSVSFPGFVEDGALAVRWVHDNARRIGGDPQHIYLMGHSAGAHIAALLTLDGHYLKAVGLDRSDIRATAGLSGPYDFKIGPKLRPVFGMTSATQPFNSAVEPINFADGREPPMMLLQGSDDTTVEPGNSARLAARIRQRGGDVQLILYPDRGHGAVVLALAFPFRWLAPVLHDTVVFFQQH